jgi:hypothetical protein
VDQRSIVLYLSLKRMAAQTIHNYLIATLGNETVADITVTKYLRTAQFDPTKVPPNSDASSPHVTSMTPTGLDRIILAAHGKEPFSLVHELARATHLTTTTVYKRLINSFGFVYVIFAGYRIFCQTLRTAMS